MFLFLDFGEMLELFLGAVTLTYRWRIRHHPFQSGLT